MNNLRKAIIMLLILMLLIITIIIIAISSINKNKEGSDYNDTEFEKDISHEEIKNTISEVTNRNEYYAVKNIIIPDCIKLSGKQIRRTYQIFNIFILPNIRIASLPIRYS